MQVFFLALMLSALCPSSFAQNTTRSIPTYAPVPSADVGPEIPSDLGYRLQSLVNGAYLITDGIYQSMFLVTTDSVIVVDAPPTIGHNMLKAIRTVTDLPISHVVYSHAHADHIGGVYLLFDQSTVSVAHEETAKALAMIKDPARPVPNITFTKDYELCAGNQTLQLSYKGLNHEIGNIFIYAPYQKVLMVVDIVYPDWVPFENLAESQSIPGWIHAHDQILEYDFDYYIGGHLNRPGTRQDVLIQQEYVTDLFNNCVEAIKLGALPPDATNSLGENATLVLDVNPNNLWALVAYADGLLSEYCTNKTNTKWLGRLAGVDVYGHSNAAVMLESLRLDYGILGAAGVQGG